MLPTEMLPTILPTDADLFHSNTEFKKANTDSEIKIKEAHKTIYETLVENKTIQTSKKEKDDAVKEQNTF